MYAGRYINISKGIQKRKKYSKAGPTPKMRLYGLINGFGEIYFEKQQELNNFCEKENISPSDSFILDFLGEFAGRTDVIRKITDEGEIKLYKAIDEDGYGIYNEERSINSDNFIWEYEYGNIREMYSAFRDRGVVFQKDVYALIDENTQKFLELCDEKIGSMKQQEKASNSTLQRIKKPQQNNIS